MAEPPKAQAPKNEIYRTENQKARKEKPKQPKKKPRHLDPKEMKKMKQTLLFDASAAYTMTTTEDEQWSAATTARRGSTMTAWA